MRFIAKLLAWRPRRAPEPSLDELRAQARARARALVDAVAAEPPPASRRSRRASA